MATGVISWSTTASTNASADSTISIPEGMAPSGVNDGMRAMMAAVAKWRNDNNGSLLTTGTSSAYDLTTNQVFSSLAAMDMQSVRFRPHALSAAGATLNVDGLGAKTLVLFTGVGIGKGALQAGQPYSATFINAANEWRMMDWAYNPTQTFLVANLPLAANYPGMRALVTNSTVSLAGNAGSTVVGGGAFTTPVTSDGNVWLIG